MKVLFHSTSSNNTDTVINSLASTGMAEVDVIRYDTRFHQRCQMALQSDPNNAALLQSGRLHFAPESVQRDAEMLTAAKERKPDIQIYISAWEGDFVPTTETLGELNSIAPLVHMCFDAGDPPWWPQIQEFDRRGIFTLTVNIDGNPVWPGGAGWAPEETKIKNGLTLLTPLDPLPFAGNQLPYGERPYSIGYAGNAGGWIRSNLVNRLQTLPGFTKKLRDDNPGSYQLYCDFLKHVQVSVSVPFTGSNATKHVKGRILESAYAGACVLEWRNAATRNWFLPRYEFEEYGSVEECLEMAAWLAGHPARAAEMALALQGRVMRDHAPPVFWNRVLQDAKRDEVPQAIQAA